MKVLSVINKFVESLICSIPSHVKGMLAERIALIFMLAKGYKPISLNDKRGFAEIDIVLEKDNVVILVEVKYRRSIEESLTAIRKTQKLRLQTQAMLMQREFPYKSIRVDGFFLAINWPFIQHIENIIEA